MKLSVDDAIVDEAKRLGKHRTANAAVAAALADYVRHLRQMQVFESFGTVEFHPDFDYKKERMRKKG